MMGTETVYRCTECGYEGNMYTFDPLEPHPQDRNCPKCGAEVEEVSEA